jgi:hypothetical protein
MSPPLASVTGHTLALRGQEVTVHHPLLGISFPFLVTEDPTVPFIVPNMLLSAIGASLHYNGPPNFGGHITIGPFKIPMDPIQSQPLNTVCTAPLFAINENTMKQRTVTFQTVQELVDQFPKALEAPLGRPSDPAPIFPTFLLGQGGGGGPRTKCHEETRGKAPPHPVRSQCHPEPQSPWSRWAPNCHHV